MGADYFLLVAEAFLQNVNSSTKIPFCQRETSNGRSRFTTQQTFQICKLIDLRQLMILVYCILEGIPKALPLSNGSIKPFQFEFWQPRSNSYGARALQRRCLNIMRYILIPFLTSFQKLFASANSCSMSFCFSSNTRISSFSFAIIFIPFP